MSKEQEAFNRISEAMDYADDMASSHYEVGDFEIVENALKRLEAIDNANPSEALENIGNIDLGDNPYKTFEHNKLKNIYNKEFTTIKQALLKAQNPKKYLKWEDLVFSFEDKYMKVKLNGNIYTLRYTRNILMEFPVVHLEFGNTDITIIDCQKQFFNDLHLESVKE